MSPTALPALSSLALFALEKGEYPMLLSALSKSIVAPMRVDDTD